MEQFGASKTTQQVINESGQQRLASNINRFSKQRNLFAGLAGVSLAFSFYYKQIQAKKSQEEVQFRKSRLALPVTDLTNANGTDIPWSKKNVQEWLYRPVRITGRPLHNRACLVPSSQHGLQGFQYIVPLCTKETEGGDPIEGVFLNKGFIPHERQYVANRFRIEDSFHQQEFTGYVSQLDKWEEHSALQAGNSPDFVRNKWNYADLKDMAKVSGFQNTAAVSVAAIESTNLDTPLDERDSNRVDISCDYREDYPYRQTLSGALQSSNMPWDFSKKGDNYLNFGLTTGLIAALLSF